MYDRPNHVSSSLPLNLFFGRVSLSASSVTFSAPETFFARLGRPFFADARMFFLFVQARIFREESEDFACKCLIDILVDSLDTFL